MSYFGHLFTSGSEARPSQAVNTQAYFDRLKEMMLQVDTFKQGMSLLMFQEENPVAFASKALNACEQWYAQTEKELYALMYGFERFHHYDQ